MSTPHCIRSWVAVALVLVIGAACGARPRVVAPVAGSRGDPAAFAAADYRAADGTPLPYRLLTPATTATGHRYPLVVILHGSGAIGTDNTAQLGPFATGWDAQATRARYPAYVLVPQFPARTVEYRPGDAPERGPVARALPPLEAALALLDSLRRALPIDSTRVYVVGFSMGGSSVWQALLARPTVFAGAVAIAGVPPAATDLRHLPRVPLLLLHGTADLENPYAAARGAYEALRRAGRRHLTFRAYPELGHAIPSDVLAGEAWRAWLFRQHR